MTIKLTALCAGFIFLMGTAARAQDSKAALITAPEAPVTETSGNEAAEQTTETPPVQVKAPALPRLTYQMEMGAMVSSGHFGYSATYLRPTAYYNINNRFRAFTSLTYLNVNGLGNSFAEGANRPFGSQHYIMQAGGQYLYSDNLTLTGSVWKDFSQTNRMNPNFNAPNRQGMSFRADYKVTDRMTISGGFRYSNGYDPGISNSLFSQPFDPIGY